MDTFRCPEPSDRQWALPLLSAEGSMGCEYNFDNIYLWSRAYPQKVARQGDRLLVQIQGSLGTSYLYPAGSVARAGSRGPLPTASPSPWSVSPGNSAGSWRVRFPAVLPGRGTGTVGIISTA